MPFITELFSLRDELLCHLPPGVFVPQLQYILNCFVLNAFAFSSSEQQPKIRGWLLASYDGQTTGLVPANYIKILGKRRGRKTVDLERITEQQPAFTSTSVRGSTAAVTLEEQEAAFDSVFAGSNKAPVASDSTVVSGEKQEL